MEMESQNSFDPVAAMMMLSKGQARNDGEMAEGDKGLL
jgi:hypothetical protein